MSVRINHVSVNALDLRRSTDFYVELVGAEPIPTPNFGIPVQWLALGRTQLHLFERDLTPTSHHHLGITVDDVAPVYRAAERWDAFDDEAFRNRLVVLPGDVVQALRPRSRRQPRRDRPPRRRPPPGRPARTGQGPVGVQPAGRRADARSALRAGVTGAVAGSPRCRCTASSSRTPCGRGRVRTSKRATSSLSTMDRSSAKPTIG